MIAGLMLVAMAAALPSAALAFPAAQPVPFNLHPAGCHSQGPMAPGPAPTSYQCCVKGHRVAIPNASFTFRPLVARLCGLNGEEGFRWGSVSCRQSGMAVVPSNSPPSAAPLRI